MSLEVLKEAIRPPSESKEAKERYLLPLEETEKWLANRLKNLGLLNGEGLFLYHTKLEMGRPYMRYDPRVNNPSAWGYWEKEDYYHDEDYCFPYPVCAVVDFDSSIPIGFLLEGEGIFSKLKPLYNSNLPPIFFSLNFQRCGFFEKIPFPSQENISKVRSRYQVLNKRLGGRGTGMIGRIEFSILEDPENDDFWLLFGLKNASAEKIFGLLPQAKGRVERKEGRVEFSPPIQRLMDRYIEKEVVPISPFRALKSDMEIEDYTYGWDDEVRNPSPQTFYITQLGVELHVKITSLAYIIFKSFQAAIPACKAIGLEILKYKFPPMSVTVIDEKEKTVQMNIPRATDKERLRWMFKVDKQIRGWQKKVK